MAASAFSFHKYAEADLANYGFHLANDPQNAVGRYGNSIAEYSDGRFRLHFQFMPWDGKAVSTYFGREWLHSGRRIGLSNAYPCFARHYGYEIDGNSVKLPDTPYDVDIVNTIVLERLETSFATVLRKLTLADIEAIEGIEPMGARLIAEHRHGPNFMDVVKIR